MSSNVVAVTPHHHGHDHPREHEHCHHGPSIPPDGSPRPGEPGFGFGLSFVDLDELRDRFAISIIPGVLAINPSINRDPTAVARLAWLIADGMIKERKMSGHCGSGHSGGSGADFFLRELLESARRGVTDGSDAKPGQIGEFFQNEAVLNLSQYPTVYQNVPLVSLTLSAGDWDISGSAGLESPFGLASIPNSGNAIAIVFEAIYSGTTEPTAFGGPAWWGVNDFNATRCSIAMPVVRASLTQSGAVGIVLQIAGWQAVTTSETPTPTTTAPAWGYISARRVR